MTLHHARDLIPYRVSLKRGDTLSPAPLPRRDFAIRSVSADDASGLNAEFIITTDAVDRHGDRIAADGWQFDAYLNNPIVAWAHDYSIPPIGKIHALIPEPGRYRAQVQFDSGDPFAQSIFAKLRSGYLNAVSVGFLPLAWEWSTDPTREYGWDISKAELLEVSVVGVPANADALIIHHPASPSSVSPLPETPSGRRALCRKAAARFHLISRMRNLP